MCQVERRVSPETWKAFRLLAFDARSGAEAAAELGMSIAAVFMAKSRVQAMIRDKVAKLEGPEPD